MDKTNSSWLKTFSIGFSIVSFGITLAIVGYILTTSKNQTVVQNQQISVSPTIPQPSPTPFIIPTTDPSITANWKTYTSKYITLRYSPFYTPTEKFTPLKGGETNFIVTNKFNFDRNKITVCDTNTYEVKPCLNPGKNHYQEKNIQPVTLDGKNVVSFFVVVPKRDGESDVLHVIQTVEDPLIEIALSIAGMGGEDEFKQILSTFQFSN